MRTRQVAAGVLVPLLLVGGCGSGRDTGARVSPPSDVGSVTTQPFGDPEVQQISTLPELPAAQVDDLHASEFNATTVHAAEDRSQLFSSRITGL